MRGGGVAISNDTRKARSSFLCLFYAHRYSDKGRAADRLIETFTFTDRTRDHQNLASFMSKVGFLIVSSNPLVRHSAKHSNIIVVDTD